MTSRLSPKACHPLGDRREAVAVCPPLVFLPAGADAELEPAAADDVDRRRHLRGEGGVPEPGADDHVAEPDALGRHRERGQDRERLERDLLGRPRHRVEVIEDPQRLEPELLGLPRQLDGARPGVRRAPAVVLALPALGRHQPDLHPDLRDRRCSPGIVPFEHGGPSRTSPPRTMSRRAGRRSEPRRAAYPRAPRQEPTMTTDRPSTRPLRCPARPSPWASAPDPEPPIRSAVSHDRHDRGRAGPGRAGSSTRLADAGGPAATLAAAVRATVEAGDPVIVTGCGTSEHGALGGRGRSCAKRRAPAGLAERLDPGGAGLRALARAAGRAVSSSASRTRAATAATNAALAAAAIGRRDRRPSSPSAAAHRRGALADDRGRDRRARPGLVPHGRLPQPDPGRRARSAHTCRVAPSTGRPSTRLLADGTRDEAGADGDRGRPRRRGAAPGRRVRIGPPRRPRARAQGRGGVVAAVRLPRPRDVPPRPPARDRTDDRARPGPHRPRPARRAARRAPGRPSPAARVIGLRAAAIRRRRPRPCARSRR